MSEENIVLEGSLSDMLNALKSFAVSLRQNWNSSSADLHQRKELIRKLRRQNYYFYRRAKREENTIVKSFYREIAQEIAAQIKQIKKHLAQPSVCLLALGNIIDRSSVDPLKRQLNILLAATAGKGLVKPVAPAAAGATGFFSWLLGRTEKVQAATALVITRDYSKWNKTRPNRPVTKLIILHTTEGSDGSSLHSVKKDGSCNYLVYRNGQVKLIIDSDKMAHHAGRSMWDGLAGLSRYSVGIEIVGYHHRELTLLQEASIKKLLVMLKIKYGVADNLILPHCQVAYGNPNQWNRRKHRPRRKCAMLLGRVATRSKLGIVSRPRSDPDIVAGRLLKSTDEKINVVFNYLYGNTEDPVKVEEEPPEKERPKVIGSDGNTAWSIAGDDYAAATTIYVFPDGLVRTGQEILLEMKKNQADKSKLNLDINHLPNKTSIFVGYIYAGRVISTRSALEIAGKEWNYPTTYYIIPRKGFKSGDGIDPAKIPENTIVLFED